MANSSLQEANDSWLIMVARWCLTWKSHVLEVAAEAGVASQTMGHLLIRANGIHNVDEDSVK